jgi:hypothetical protein
MYRPTEDQIMVMAQRALQGRIAENGARPPPPTVDPIRRQRSLQSCHRFTLDEPELHPMPKTNGYVPELAARLERDRNLCDGARRCARILAEYTYRRRDGRSAHITVTYLMRGLCRDRRTVQRYLRKLERAGYIATTVLKAKTRMCVGLIVELLAPLFPRHAAKWPARLMKPDAARMSLNKRYLDIYERIPVHHWALHCMEGVWRAFNRAYPPGTLPIS